MDPIPKEELKELLERAGHCVSLYMPTHRAGPEIRKDPILLKNLLRQAEERLTGRGLRASEAREILAPAARVQEDPFFWRHQSDGLAFFLSRDFSRYYRLPLPFEESAWVAGRFRIKPVIPMLSSGNRFFILALSQNEVRFLNCSRYSAEEVEMENVPKNMEEALRYDNPEQQIQLHTGTPRATATGKRAAMFHGQGGKEDQHKERVMRFLQLVHKGLKNTLRDEQSPLVIAGVEFLVPLYRELNKYPYLLDEGIPGNPEVLRPEELQKEGWKIVERFSSKSREQAIAKFRELMGSSRSSADLREIVPAAYHGRVETLFVAAGITRWGTFDTETGAVEEHKEAVPGDEDLLDLASAQTFLNNGIVYEVKAENVPDGTSVAAVFRY